MVTVVYADVLLIINFCVDYICLYCAGRLCSVPVKGWRIALAAAAGATYVFFTLVFSNLFLHLVAGFAVCLIAFPARIKDMLRLYICFMLFAALLGGVFTAVYNMTAGSDGLLFALPLVAAAGFMFFYGNKKKLAVRTAYIELEDGETVLKLTALADSGCLLNDPLSGDPVIIVKKSALPSDFEISEKKYYHPIPASGIGQSVLFAFRPAKVSVRRFASRSFSERRAVVAVDEREGSFGGCPALVPVSIIP